MTGCAAEKVRVAIVDFAPDDATAPTGVGSYRTPTCRGSDRVIDIRPFAHIALVSIPALTCCDAGLHRARGVEKRASQSQWLNDFRLRKLIERLPSQTLQQETEHDETKVAVNHSFARSIFE